MPGYTLFKTMTNGGCIARGFQAVTLALLMAAAPLSGQVPAASLRARDLYYEKEQLGLRYRILQQDRSGGLFGAVKSDTVFHTGDRIRLELETNVAGFVYVVQQGSDSSWQILFPSAEIRDRRNQMDPMKTFQVPASQEFFFDKVPGRERLFAVALSRTPVTNLERLLQTVQGGTAGLAAAPTPTTPETLVAALNRDLLSRNLGVVRSEETGADPVLKNSVYVLTAKAAEDLIVQEIVLAHEP